MLGFILYIRDFIKVIINKKNNNVCKCILLKLKYKWYFYTLRILSILLG